MFALNASLLTRKCQLRCGLSNLYAFSLVAVVARCLVIFFFLALTGCGFGNLRRVESLLLDVLDLCPRADPAGANIVAYGDSFAWLGCKGDLIDTKSSTVGDRFEMGGWFVGHWFGRVVFGKKSELREIEWRGLGCLAKILVQRFQLTVTEMMFPQPTLRSIEL